MISYQFWIALMTPYVSHPLFIRRGIWQPTDFSEKKGFFNKIAYFYIKNEKDVLWETLGVIILLAILLGHDKVIIIVVLGVLGMLVIGFPLLLFLSGSIYGIASAIVISGAIINERLQGRYLILGVTPQGFLGASWALCSLCIQNSVLLRQLRNIMRTIYTILLSLVLLPFTIVTMFYLINSEAPHVYNLWGALVVGLGVSLMIIIEFFQSACVGSLLGILAAHHNETRANTQSSVTSNFIVLQVAIYLMAAFLCIIIIPGLFALISYPITPFYIFICALVMYFCRESLVIMLWHGLAITLDEDIEQVNRLTRVYIQDRSWIGGGARRLLRLLWRNPLD